MGRYYLVKDGYLIQTGICPDGDEEYQAFNGCTVGLGDPPIELQPAPVVLPDPLLIVRYTRDQLLMASDWTQLPDVPLVTKEAWATYRQSLRDITEQVDPLNIVWPTKPS